MFKGLCPEVEELCSLIEDIQIGDTVYVKEHIDSIFLRYEITILQNADNKEVLDGLLDPKQTKTLKLIKEYIVKIVDIDDNPLSFNYNTDIKMKVFVDWGCPDDLDNYIVTKNQELYNIFIKDEKLMKEYMFRKRTETINKLEDVCIDKIHFHSNILKEINRKDW